MNDTSFLYFTQDDVISKIDIDPRLIDSFKRVMTKMQEYFNANGYTEDRNYREFLERHLLNSGENNFRFYINELLNKNIGGVYVKDKNEICINENQLSSKQERLDATLCHEIIHFLVMHDLNEEKSDSEIFNGGFLNEALTEMLTREMYPNSTSYEPHVRMHKFSNLLSDNVNNFRMFLRGYIPGSRSNREWDNYVRAVNRFQYTFHKKGFISIRECQNNPDYIEAQRALINLFIHPHALKSFEGYCEDISKLIDRPVEDKEFVNKVIERMDDTIIRNLFIDNPKINEILKQKLVEVRENIADSKKYKGKKVYEFDFAGRKLALDENLEFIGNIVGISRQWSPEKRTFTLILNGEKLQFNVDEIDFLEREKELQDNIKKLSNFYSTMSKTNLKMINDATEQPSELLRIEKFSLPRISGSKRKILPEVYVAVYSDKLIVLNDCEQINSVSNLPLNRYIGMTSKDPNTALIYTDQIGVIENGILFSTLNQKQINNLLIGRIIQEIEDNLSEEELQKGIDKYKLTDYYFEEDSDEIIKEEALRIIAEEKFEQLPEDEKKKLSEMLREEYDKFIVTIQDGQVSVGLVFGDNGFFNFNADSQVLYDSEGSGIYNEIFDELEKNKSEQKKDFKNQFEVDKNGNLILQNQRLNETEKTTKENEEKGDRD